jgi:tetratricopeptide (TPR) repeat protein
LEALELIAQKPPGKLRLAVASGLGSISVTMNEVPEAREYLKQALQTAHVLRSFNEASPLSNLSLLEYQAGNVGRAIELGRETVARARTIPGHRHLGYALTNLAAYLLADENPAEARVYAEEAFGRLGELDIQLPVLLQKWAVLAAFEGRLAAAAQLIGFLDAEHLRRGYPRAIFEQRLYDELMRRLEAGLPAADLAARQAEGAPWTEAEAIEFTTTRLVPRRAAG